MRKIAQLDRQLKPYGLGSTPDDPKTKANILAVHTETSCITGSEYGRIHEGLDLSFLDHMEERIGHPEANEDFELWMADLNTAIRPSIFKSDLSLEDLASYLTSKAESVLLASKQRKASFRKVTDLRKGESLEERINREKQYKTNHDIKVKAIKERRLEFKYKRPQLLLQMLASGMLYQCATTGCLNEDITIDHKTPIALGGGDDLENLQFLCRSCNSKKGAKIIKEIE